MRGMHDMITKSAQREIIEDFAVEIKNRRRIGAKPSKEVVFFRDEHRKQIERDVYEVPTELLRYRKDNGRISSDIFSYERNYGPLTEKSEEAQKVIKSFLEHKDPNKTKELISSIKHSGQRAAAIITSDGFLINGNRRKMSLEKLWDETHDEQYLWMKVVILPGYGDEKEGGPPTLKEIEQIENRYQLQSEGKSEYYNFDRALSMRRKIELGMSLEEQLRDDPNFSKMSSKDFNKVLKKYEDEFIKPLECIDRYLKYLGREGLYYTVSSGVADRFGRWQAFLDYYNYVYKKLQDKKNLIKFGIDEEETGNIEEIAFKIIRKKDFKGHKAHKIMRDFLKLLKNDEAKKELFELLDIDMNLDDESDETDEKKKDQIWGKRYSSKFHKHVNNAIKIYEHEKECETPLTLLESALKKLEHENMIPEAVNIHDIPQAMKLSEKIKKVADDLKSLFYVLMKQNK